MAETKIQDQVLEELCGKMLEIKKNVTGMRSLLHDTFNHQNDPIRSAAVILDAKSSMVNMHCGASSETMWDILRICPDQMFL